MQIEPIWHSVNPMQMATASNLNNHDQKKIVCKFDDGTICMYLDEHPFAEMTEVFFLP